MLDSESTSDSGKSAKKQKEILKTIEQVKTDLKKYRHQFEREWRDYDDAYHGKIWQNTNENKPYENFIFQLIQDELPVLTDSYDAPVVNPKDPAKRPQAMNLQESIEWVNRNQDLQGNLVDLNRNMLMSAPGYLHTYYDYSANGGNGEIKDEVLPWHQVYLDGAVQKIEQIRKARIEVIRDRSWLMKNYPKYRKQLKTVKSDQSSDDNTKDEGLENYDTGSGWAARTKPKPYKDKDTLTQVFTYIKDDSMVKISNEVTMQELEDEANALQSLQSADVSLYQDHTGHQEGHGQLLAQLYGQLELTPDQGFEAAEQIAEQIAQESPESGVEDILFTIKLTETHIAEHEELKKINPNGETPKYPNEWRVVESVDKVILYDGENKYDHNEVPLVLWVAYKNGTIYGSGEIRNIIDSQRMQAVMQYKEYKGLQRVANPEKHVDIETGLTEDDITNEEGAVYFLPQGSRIRNESPGKISNQLAPFNQERKQAMTSISGISTPTDPDSIDPRVAAETVRRVDNNAVGRMRLKDRQNQVSIRRLGKLRASMIVQFWTSERSLKLENEGEETREIIFNPLEMMDLEYDVEIAAGSMAGVDKDAFNSYLHNLKRDGDITFKQYAELADQPKSEKLMQFADENDQVQSQVQELEGQVQQLQLENIKMKHKVSPELLTDDEEKMLLESQRQELTEQMVNQGTPQPEQPQ